MSFNKYLDTILAAHQPPPGSNRQNQSPWLFLDSANTIFETAKRRVYTGKPVEGDAASTSEALPDSLRPILEEQPKWSVLAEILDEIERDVYFNPIVQDDSNGTILIMCSDHNTCRQLREYVQNMHVRPLQQDSTDDIAGEEVESKPSATFMMRRKLRNYLDWKKDFARVSASLFAENQKALNGYTDQSGANGYKGKGPPNKRRRVRGGSVAAAGGGRPVNSSLQIAEDKAVQVEGLMAEIRPTDVDAAQKEEVAVDSLEDMEDYFEVYEMQDIVVIHPYDGDQDEHVLEEVRPRYVIMYEPDAAFIRRVEVYRSSHDNRNIRVYFMYYGGSVEEQRYLSAVRKEKDAFTRLIKERAVSASTSSFGCSSLTCSEYVHHARYRRLYDRPSRTIPPYHKHSDCRWWPFSCNRRASTGGGRRPRIPLLPAFPTARQFYGCHPLYADCRRLRDLPQHLHRAKISPRPDLILQKRASLQSSGDDAPALQEPNAAH